MILVKHFNCNVSLHITLSGFQRIYKINTNKQLTLKQYVC